MQFVQFVSFFWYSSLQTEETSTQGLQLQLASVRAANNGNSKVNQLFLMKQRQMEAQLQAKLDSEKKINEPDDNDDSGPGGDAARAGVDARLGSDAPGPAYSTLDRLSMVLLW